MASGRDCIKPDSAVRTPCRDHLALWNLRPLRTLPISSLLPRGVWEVLLPWLIPLRLGLLPLRLSLTLWLLPLLIGLSLLILPLLIRLSLLPLLTLLIRVNRPGGGSRRPRARWRESGPDLHVGWRLR